LIGFFVNTLVLRGRFDGEGSTLSFAAVVERMRITALGAYAHQDMPFERLVEELQVERSLAHAPVFQVMLSFQAEPAAFELPGLTLRPLDLAAEAAKLDLELALAEVGEGLAGGLEISRDLFDATTGMRIAGQLEILLAAAVAEPERPVADLPLLAAAERHQLLLAFNDTALGVPGWESFEERLAAGLRAPSRRAGGGLRGGEPHLSGARPPVRQLARRLARRGVTTESLVALLAPRGLDLLLAVLAVLRAGGAYLPLDPTQPAPRLRQLLRQSGAGWLLWAGDAPRRCSTVRCPRPRGRGTRGVSGGR